MDGQGNLYGTTSQGGAYRSGTVFEIAAGSNAITTLASFNGSDGFDPNSSLVIDGQGNLYGTTESSGAQGTGTVFEIAAGSGTVTTLALFNYFWNGANPDAGLVLDGQGNPGTTSQGGGEGSG